MGGGEPRGRCCPIFATSSGESLPTRRRRCSSDSPTTSLHHEIRQPRDHVLIDLVNGDEVVVGDGGGSAGLAAEALAGHFVVRQLRIEHLDGDIALQARIVALQHDAHAAAGRRRA